MATPLIDKSMMIYLLHPRIEWINF